MLHYALQITAIIKGWFKQRNLGYFNFGECFQFNLKNILIHFKDNLIVFYASYNI